METRMQYKTWSGKWMTYGEIEKAWQEYETKARRAEQREDYEDAERCAEIAANYRKDAKKTWIIK